MANYYEVIINGENLDSVINYYPMGGFSPEVYQVTNGVPVLLPSDGFSVTMGRAVVISKPKDGFIIESARNVYGHIDFTPEKLEYELGGNLIGLSSYTTLTIETKSSEKFFEIIVNGENLNSVINYYPMGGFNPDVYPVENGVPVLLPAKDFGVTIGRADLVSKVDDGFIITHAKNEIGEIPFDSEKVEYSLGGNIIDDKRYTTFTITTEGDVTPPDPTDKSIMNNYLLTDSELMEFQKKVYDVVNTESVNEGRGALELTNFLNSVKVFPFIISEDNLGVRESIKIRDKQLNVATTIIKDSIKLDLGVIEFEKEFNNSLDYMGVKIDVYLPFCNGTISLQPSEVIGKNILIIANVNVYDGAVTINFKDAETYINISSANFGANFPFFNLYDIKQSDLNPTQAVNTLLQAYAIITKPNYASGRKMATREGKLLDDSGYIEVIDISLKTVAYLEEKQQILSLLNRGVKIC